MNYPALVYKSPGGYRYPKTKKTYSVKSVADEQQLAEAIARGWFETREQAVGIQKVEEVKAEALTSETVEIKEDAAPTRAELEQKAKELGIKFDGRTSDSRLLKLITERVSNELD